MKRLKDYIKKSAKAFKILVVGSVFAGLCNLIFYPILCRLYTQEEIGLLSGITTIVSLSSIVSTGKYEQAIITTQKKNEAVLLLVLSMLICVCVTIVYYVLLLFGLLDFLKVVFHDEMIMKLAFICPFSFVGISAFNCYNEWCIKEKRYSSLSKNRISNSVFVCFFKTILFKITSGICIGDIFGRFFNGVFTLAQFYIHDHKALKKEIITKKRIKFVAIKYRDYPIYIIPDQILNYIAGTLPIYYISYCYDLERLGYYSMSVSILSIPAAFLEKTFLDLFRSQATDSYNKTGGFREIYVNMLMLLGGAGIVLFVLGFFAIPPVIKAFLGDKWIVTGTISQILFLPSILKFLFLVFSPTWIIKNKLKYRLFWQISNIIVVSAVMLITSYSSISFEQCIIFLGIGMSISYLLGIGNTFILSK